MATDLTALAETFARYSRQVAGLAEPFELLPSNDSPGVEPARQRVASAFHDLDAPGPLPAARLQRLWLGVVNDLKYLEDEPLRAALGRFLAAAGDGLRFVAACRAALLAADDPTDLRGGEYRYRFVADQARKRLDAVGRPLEVRDPERLAAAIKRADELGTWLTPEQAVEYFRAERAGQ